MKAATIGLSYQFCHSPGMSSKAAVRAMLNARHQGPYNAPAPAPPQNASMTMQNIRMRQMQLQRLNNQGNMVGGPGTAMYGNQFGPQQQRMQQMQQIGTGSYTSGPAMQGGSGYPMQQGMMVPSGGNGPVGSSTTMPVSSVPAQGFTNGTSIYSQSNVAQPQQAMMTNPMGQPGNQFVASGGMAMTGPRMPGPSSMSTAGPMVVQSANTVDPTQPNQPMNIQQQQQQQQRMMQLAARQGNVQSNQPQPQTGFNNMQYMMQQQGGNPQMMSQLQRQLTQGGGPVTSGGPQPGNNGQPFPGQPGGPTHY
jgi:hypothetical protein